MSDKPLLLFTAPVGTRSGYGHHARDIVRTLIDMDKFDIRIMDLRWGGTPRNALKTDNPDHIPIIERLMKDKKLERQPEIHVHLTVPNEFQPIAKYNIGITAGIETTMCSAQWIEGLNRMNLIIVPSNHVKNVFMNSVWTQRDQRTNQPIKQLNLERPVEVLFEGADTNVYHRIPKTGDFPKLVVDEMKNVKTSFNFLYVGHWLKGDLGQDRKDVGMLIKVFFETFKNQKQTPGLILKTSGAGFSVMDREEIKKKIMAIKNMVRAETLPPVYLLHGELTDEEMNALNNHPKVKAHITFTKGEGFGRPLLEATLSGKPVIASGWSGQMDFLNRNLATLLPGQLTPVHKSAQWENVIIPESQWYTVNYNYASAAIKDIYKNYKKYETNAKTLAEINRQKFTREKMKDHLERILDQYLPEFPKQIQANLPNLPQAGGGLPQLKKVGSQLAGNDNQITLPKLSKVNDVPTEVVLPKLKKLEAEEPEHGSGISPEPEIKTELPKLKVQGSSKDGEEDGDERVSVS